MQILDSSSFAQLLVSEHIFVINEAQPFTWTSGLVMPFYCDHRSILGKPDFRRKVITSLCHLIKEIPNYMQYSLVGVVSAGVPWASILSHELDMPLGYVRSQKKEHGKKNALEGNLDPQKPIIIIEDLVSTAKSLVHAYKTLKEEGHNPTQAVSLFSYNFKLAHEELDRIHLPLRSISNFKILNSILDRPIQLTKDQRDLFLE